MNLLSRRKLLDNMGRTASALAVPSVYGAEPSDAPIPNREPHKLKVVVAGGHPGDPEYGCAGTVARYTDLGHEVVLLYLNRGGAGSPKLPAGELAALRTIEAAKACQILKARSAYAGQLDGKSVIDAAHYEEFRKILEAERPDVLFTQWPIDHHPDHRATSMLAYDAWLHMGKSFGFYYYEVSDGEDTQMFSPTHYVDIAAVEPRKRAACYAHASQTPDKFYALETEIARFRGIESGYAQAEAFIRHTQSPVDLLPS
ncbi:MAG: PIG-L deacetylase family protein [Bryobacteraceae bacterium]